MCLQVSYHSPPSSPYILVLNDEMGFMSSNSLKKV
ncbi:conserved hypothetical protein, partial [Listeria seeligeri FSL N1-067]